MMCSVDRHHSVTAAENPKEVVHWLMVLPGLLLSMKRKMKRRLMETLEMPVKLVQKELLENVVGQSSCPQNQNGRRQDRLRCHFEVFGGEKEGRERCLAWVKEQGKVSLNQSGK